MCLSLLELLLQHVRLLVPPTSFLLPKSPSCQNRKRRKAKKVRRYAYRESSKTSCKSLTISPNAERSRGEVSGREGSEREQPILSGCLLWKETPVSFELTRHLPSMEGGHLIIACYAAFAPSFYTYDRGAPSHRERVLAQSPAQ